MYDLSKFIEISDYIFSIIFLAFLVFRVVLVYCCVVEPTNQLSEFFALHDDVVSLDSWHCGSMEI